MSTDRAGTGGPSKSSMLRIGLLMTGVSVVIAACATPPAVRQAERTVAATRAGGDESFSLLRLADNLAAEGKYAAAVPLYRRAHDKESGDAAPLIGLGRALSALGRYDESVEVFQQAIERDSGRGAAYRGLGGAWMALGSPAYALEAFNQALSINRRDAEAWNGKALALDRLGRHDEALAAFRSGLDVAPDSLSLRGNYGLSMALADDFEEAIPLLEKVALDAKAGPRERQNLALAYALAGRDDAAGRVAAIDLDLEDVQTNLAFYADLRGMPPQARREALMGSVRRPRQDLAQPANQDFSTEDKQAVAAMERLLTEPEPVPEPEPEPAPEPEPEPQPEPEIALPPLVDPNGYAVQLAAYRHADELWKGWKILSEKYADLIGDLEPRRSEKDFGDREEPPRGFFYRLNAGTLWSLAEAREICNQIVARGGDCWVRPPEPTEGRLPEKAEPDEASDPSQETEALPAPDTEPRAVPGG